MTQRRMPVAPTAILLTAAMLVAPTTVFGQSDADAKRHAETVAKGLEYLRNHGQADDGTFSAKAGPGLTALALTAAMRNGVPVTDPMVKKGLAALERFVKADGGIYGSGRLKNYETCVAMICFAEANKNGRYNAILKNAKAFITGMQFGKGQDPSHPWYGGSGYSSSGRPDLSNTSYFVEAMRAADASADDAALKRALVFISRCQNHDSKFNDTKFAKLVDDGGFYYGIPTESVDPKDERATANGGLRSYGSMTYSGLKSMIYAGLTADDPRVKAATKWIAKHYTVENNPGMGTAGLYYYYHTFAASLNAAGIGKLKDADGKEHDWRSDLVAELARRQAADGSWANENARWFENDKNLSTSFALMALSYCKPTSTAK